MATWTNESKNTSTFTDEAKRSINTDTYIAGFDVARFDVGKFDISLVIYTNETKNTTSWTNETKN